MKKCCRIAKDTIEAADACLAVNFAPGSFMLSEDREAAKKHLAECAERKKVGR